MPGRPADRLRLARDRAGLTCTTAGYVVEVGFLFTRGWVPYPSAADILFLLCYPVFLVGLLRFPTRPQSRAERLRLGLDVATISLSAASVIWRVVLSPTLASGSDHSLAVLVSAAYPTADLLMVFGVARLLVRGASPGARRAAQLLGAGMLATIVGDFLYTYAALHSGQINGAYSSIGYVVADATFFSAALCQRLPGPDREDRAARSADTPSVRARSAVLLPYLAPFVLIALLVESQFAPNKMSRLTLTIATAVVLLLVTARQLTVQRDLSATVRLVTDKTEQLRHQASPRRPDRDCPTAR